MTDLYYKYYLVVYLITAMFSFYLNRNSRGSIFITLILLLDAFVPIPAHFWYLNCIAIELIVILSTLLTKSYISDVVRYLSVQMVILHIAGMVYHGGSYNSPYRFLANFTEYLQILSCVILSNPIINKIKGAVKCHLQKF